ncbi:ABC transporter permease [Adlercreutzia sp. ZJ154]|uniref:ABC transporter permease n=1 Tax=Adlercreutzia sp. ZJ154 TaxID=2709790 RepID=UPI0013EE1CA1|nr:ABC transporter permease [Adlercreutzia sp. ZJ154]
MAKRYHKKQHGHIILFALALLLFLLALLFYTFLTSDPRDTKLGIVSLDEGVQTSQGQSNLGSQMVEKLTSGELFTATPGSSETHLNSYSIEFKTYKTQDELNTALENEEVTGAIVIPEDYTKRKINETTQNITNSTEDVKNAVVDVVVEKTTDPVLQQQVGSSITRLLNTAGLSASSEYPGSSISGEIGERDVDPLCHVWLLLPPIVASLLLSVAYPIRRGATFAVRVRRLVVAALASALLSILVAIGDYLILVNAYHYTNVLLPSIGELWVMSFLVMLFFGGLAQIRLWLAALAAGLLLLIGAIAGWVSLEAFPEPILPWIVETFTDASLNDIVSNVPGITIWNSGVHALWSYALVGVILAIATAAFSRPDRSYDYE